VILHRAGGGVENCLPVGISRRWVFALLFCPLVAGAADPAPTLTLLEGPAGLVRGASVTTDMNRLYRMLSENLTKPEERSAFLAGREKLQGLAPRDAEMTAAQDRAPATGQTVQLTPGAIEEATRKLSAYLGPIAKVVAKQAATQASSRNHFHQLLAEKLTDPKERAKFLKEVGAG
jgi:serine/threonine-protein kinase